MISLVALIMIIIKLVNCHNDEYLTESQQQCLKKNNAISCSKYHSLKYLTALVEYYDIGNVSSSYPVGLVKMPEFYQDENVLFSSARQLPGDSEFTKFLKFVQRQTNFYLGNQGISFNLPEGAQIIEESIKTNVDEGRGKKKKAAMVIMPLLILLKLVKIKLMVAIALVGVLVIKKAVFLAALVLPTLLNQLKQCGKSHYYHPQSHHHAEPEYHEHDDYSNGYGGGYGKDYDRAYSAHKG